MRGDGDVSDDRGGTRKRALVTVEFTVPVLCQIDVRNGTVERVTVVDEEISGPGAVHDPDGSQASTPISNLARAVAAEAPWPAWELGR